MKILGLHGLPHVGKDAIADYLVEAYGVVKAGFGDALYAEVCEAFDIPLELLTNPQTKEESTTALAVFHCLDPHFRDVMVNYDLAVYRGSKTDYLFTPRSPRTILDQWGTQYRRAQDQEYWVTRLRARLDHLIRKMNCPGVVIKDVRRFNEADMVKTEDGLIFQVIRPGTFALSDSVIHHVLPEGYIDGIIHNDGSLSSLYLSAGRVAEQLGWG